METGKSGERLEPAVFDRRSASWTEAREVEDRSAHTPVVNGSPGDGPFPCCGIKVVTWNIWFAPYYFQLRVGAMLRVVRACDPDVICLQEVTPASLAIILQQPWIRERYRVSDAMGVTVNPYGVLILSRQPIRALRRFILPSEMGRNLLTAEVETGAGPLIIGTVHLESLNNPELRREQLEIIFPVLKSLGQHAMLVGDFNLCSSWKAENDHLDPEFVDLWPALRAGEVGYSEDTEVNLMLLNAKGKKKQVRFDRMLLRSEGGRWRPESIERLGTAPVVLSMPDVFPSDHFGLVSRLETVPVGCP